MQPTVCSHLAMLSFIVSALFSSLCTAQIPTNTSSFANKTTFPSEQKDNVTQYLWQAEAVASELPLFREYVRDQCITAQVYPQFEQRLGFVQPFSPFENVYWVGQSWVQAWAINTTDGIVLIDTLDDPDEVKAIILPGLAYFGFSGNDIRHTIITHEHADHYGGARYLQDTYHSNAYASAVAWDAYEGYLKDTSPTPPTRNITVSDGEDLTIGGQTFHVVLTPGHTNGTLSLIFPVFDKRSQEQHIVGMLGGSAPPANASSKEAAILSHDKLAKIGTGMGVDTIMSNHQEYDSALWNADLLAHEPAGHYKNPFVVGGGDKWAKYMEIFNLCHRVLAARLNQTLHV